MNVITHRQRETVTDRDTRGLKKLEKVPAGDNVAQRIDATCIVVCRTGLGCLFQSSERRPQKKYLCIETNLNLCFMRSSARPWPTVCSIFGLYAGYFSRSIHIVAQPFARAHPCSRPWGSRCSLCP